MSECRNILSVWLGAYIYKKRKETSCSPKDLSKSIDVSMPYLRMVETGVTNLAPSRAINLISGLNSLNVDPLFSRISIYLTSIQYLSSDNSDVQTQQRKIEEIKEYDASLKKLLLGLNDTIWRLLEDVKYEEIRKELTSDALKSEMNKYLSDEKYFHFVSEDENNFLKDKLVELYNKTPSVYNNIFKRKINLLNEEINFIEGDATLYYDLPLWEIKNQHKFTLLRGVINNIVTLNADFFFPWEYLFYKDFVKMQLFVDKNTDWKTINKEQIEEYKIEIFQDKLLSIIVDLIKEYIIPKYFWEVVVERQGENFKKHFGNELELAKNKHKQELGNRERRINLHEENLISESKLEERKEYYESKIKHIDEGNLKKIKDQLDELVKKNIDAKKWIEILIDEKDLIEDKDFLKKIIINTIQNKVVIEPYNDKCKQLFNEKDSNKNKIWNYTEKCWNELWLYKFKDEDDWVGFYFEEELTGFDDIFDKKDSDKTDKIKKLINEQTSKFISLTNYKVNLVLNTI